MPAAELRSILPAAAEGLSQALFSCRLLQHDRGRVLTDIACAIADGARAVSDFRVLADQAIPGWTAVSIRRRAPLYLCTG